MKWYKTAPSGVAQFVRYEFGAACDNKFPTCQGHIGAQSINRTKSSRDISKLHSPDSPIIALNL